MQLTTQAKLLAKVCATVWLIVVYGNVIYTIYSGNEFTTLEHMGTGFFVWVMLMLFACLMHMMYRKHTN